MAEPVTFQDAFIDKMDTICDPNGAYPKKGEYGTIPSQAPRGNETEKRDEDHEVRPFWRQFNALEDDDDSSSSNSSTGSRSLASNKGHYSFAPSPYYEERDGDDETLSFGSTVFDEDDMTVMTCDDSDNGSEGDFKVVLSQVGSGSSLLASDISGLTLKDMIKSAVSEFARAEPVTATAKVSDNGSTSKPPPPTFNAELPVIAEDDTEQAPQVKTEKIIIEEKNDEEEKIKEKKEPFFPTTLVVANDVVQDEQEPITTTEVDDQEERVVFFNCTSATDDVVEHYTSVQSTMVDDARDAVNKLFGYNRDEPPSCEVVKPTDEKENVVFEAPVPQRKKRFNLGKLRKKKGSRQGKNCFRRWRAASS
mmetsp:Transcript_37588/g.76508  ORF Transcript_37588/g.76508 Transcript_37588/m.76508 type:complete len:364 (+) Transcript_37588:339-1430(+)